MFNALLRILGRVTSNTSTNESTEELSICSESEVNPPINSSNITELARQIKMAGGVGPRIVNLSNDDTDSLNKVRKQSSRIIEDLT